MTTGLVIQVPLFVNI
ncbi:MAG: hypothetical protein LBQ59_05745 [Candidatus Peribacteria bacterium]|nr:hypothetical protein [Candidatus Peribacteria bacterium]